MKTTFIVLFGLQALTASACVLVGRSCVLGGDDCCGRRTCILTSASAGFCVQSQAALAAPAPGLQPQQPRPAQGQQPNLGEFPNPNIGGGGSANETMGNSPSMNMPSNNNNNGGGGGQAGNGQYNNGQYNNGQNGNGQFNNGQYGNGPYKNGQYSNVQGAGGQSKNGQIAYASNSRVSGIKPRVHNQRDWDYFKPSQADPSNHE